MELADDSVDKHMGQKMIDKALDILEKGQYFNELCSRQDLEQHIQSSIETGNTIEGICAAGLKKIQKSRVEEEQLKSKILEKNRKTVD